MSDLKMPQHVANELYAWALELRRPSLMFQPKIALDGNQWCVLLGDNIQEGVCGFGDTPELAFLDFDRAFHSNEETRSK